MAKRPSAPKPCTLAPAGGPRALQPIELFKHCGESCGVQRGTVAREPPKNKAKSESAIELYVRCSVFSKI